MSKFNKKRKIEFDAHMERLLGDAKIIKENLDSEGYREVDSYEISRDSYRFFVNAFCFFIFSGSFLVMISSFLLLIKPPSDTFLTGTDGSVASVPYFLSLGDVNTPADEVR